MTEEIDDNGFGISDGYVVCLLCAALLLKRRDESVDELKARHTCARKDLVRVRDAYMNVSCEKISDLIT